MGAETSGRKLGIGLRLAARAARERAGMHSAPSTAASAAPVPSSSGVKAASPTQAAASKAKALGRGTKRFGEAVVGPMAHTSGVLWLEITGLFFGLFAAFFAQYVYRFRHDYKSGPDHTQFLVYSGFTAAFVWFTLFNFYKARRKEKKNRARQAAGASR